MLSAVDVVEITCTTIVIDVLIFVVMSALDVVERIWLLLLLSWSSCRHWTLLHNHHRYCIIVDVAMSLLYSRFAGPRRRRGLVVVVVGVSP